MKTHVLWLFLILDMNHPFSRAAQSLLPQESSKLQGFWPVKRPHRRWCLGAEVASKLVAGGRGEVNVSGSC